MNEEVWLDPLLRVWATSVSLMFLTTLGVFLWEVVKVMNRWKSSTGFALLYVVVGTVYVVFGWAWWLAAVWYIGAVLWGFTALRQHGGPLAARVMQTLAPIWPTRGPRLLNALEFGKWDKLLRPEDRQRWATFLAGEAQRGSTEVALGLDMGVWTMWARYELGGRTVGDDAIRMHIGLQDVYVPRSAPGWGERSRPDKDPWGPTSLPDDLITVPVFEARLKGVR